jgi:hypothetical protein
MPKSFEEDGYNRAWFTFIQNHENLEEALCYIKGFLEEAVLSHTKLLVEIHIPNRLPQNIKNPVRCNHTDIRTS